jgi:hypothetical protein
VALTKYNFNSFDVTTAASKALGFNASANGLTTISPGSMTFIKSINAGTSGSTNVNFVNGTSDVVLDSTYPVYLFKLIDIHPSSNDIFFQVNFRDGGSSYDAVKTTTSFSAYHNEAGNDTSLGYRTGSDLAQSTSAQRLSTDSVGNGNDENTSGELYLFNPASTSFVKNFMAVTSAYHDGDYIFNSYVAGYCNTTTAIDGVQFNFSSGNFDQGIIKLYGIKDS